MEVMSANHMPVLRINAPEFYEDEEFVGWLDGYDQIATWHNKGFPPTDYSDVFCTRDGVEGSNSDMPAHIWEQLCQAADEAYGPDQECLIWLSNLKE